jgi:Tol biopolymer transport system component
VYFASNRSGSAQIWRMNADGSNQAQITTNNGGVPLFVTPDNRLLYYKHSITGTLWAVSLENGEEKLVLDQARNFFSFSPDGSMIASDNRAADGLTLTIYTIDDGTARRSFALPKRLPRLVELSWMPDGRSLIYLMTGIDYDKNTIFQQSIDGGEPREIGSVGDDEISEVSGLSIAPDGKSFTIAQGGWKHDAVLITGLR